MQPCCGSANQLRVQQQQQVQLAQVPAALPGFDKGNASLGTVIMARSTTRTSASGATAGTARCSTVIVHHLHQHDVVLARALAAWALGSRVGEQAEDCNEGGAASLEWAEAKGLVQSPKAGGAVHTEAAVAALEQHSVPFPACAGEAVNLETFCFAGPAYSFYRFQALQPIMHTRHTYT